MVHVFENFENCLLFLKTKGTRSGFQIFYLSFKMILQVFKINVLFFWKYFFF